MPRFVIQEHYARAHHFDFRLERDGVLKSWAVPKEIPMEVGIRRLAIQVPDHALSFGNFEGEIEEGQYGAGTITIWDQGEYEEIEWLADSITVNIHGEKVEGTYTLIPFRKAGANEWLLFKRREA